MEGMNYAFFQILFNSGYNPYTFTSGAEASAIYENVFQLLKFVVFYHQ